MRTYRFTISECVSVFIDAESKDSAINEFRTLFGCLLYFQVKTIQLFNS